MSAIKITTSERPFLAELYFSFFLRKSGLGDTEAARWYIAEAIRLSPLLVGRLEELVADWSVNQTCGPPLKLAQLVLENLPADLVNSGRLRRRVLAKIHIAQAFDERRRGHAARTRRHVLNAWRYDPTVLKNRGVRAILVRSFLGNQAPALHPIPDCATLNESIPKSVMSGVESVTGCAVDHVERITTGESGGGIYVIQAGGQAYILRILKVATGVLEEKIATAERVREVGVPAPAIIASSLSVPMTQDRLAWLLEEWMPGAWFEPSEMPHTQVLSIVADLGRHLRLLHSVRIAGFGPMHSAQIGAPHRTFGAWLDSRRQTIQQACLAGILPETVAQTLDVADRFLRETYSGPPVLCHCELSDGNILVDRGLVSAIIDWDSATGTDPAYDIATFLTTMGEYWYPAEDHLMLRTLLQAYKVEEMEVFYRRVIAHRLLFVASALTSIMQDYGKECCNLWVSILTDAKQVDFIAGIGGLPAPSWT